ncbi:MAG: RNA methyltransferase [Lachnospiraceae bacterium]|nr:RNA methyltransferase [Lachnospiraceae bacterium]
MIKSVSNGRVKQIVQWQTKAKERRKDGVFLAEGIKMFEEAPEELVQEVYLSADIEKKLREKQTTFEKLQRTGYEVVLPEVFAKMSDTQTPQGILTVLKRLEYDLEELLDKPDSLFVILENLQDPGNLGTIVRTGEGAGITGVIMSNQTVDIYNPKTIRATMGSVYRVPFLYVDDLREVMRKLREKGVHTYAAHLQGSNYYDTFSLRESTAFLIGNEGNGLSKELADMAENYLKIPMEGQVESLNAAVAAALLMYETHRQRSQ